MPSGLVPGNHRILFCNNKIKKNLFTKGKLCMEYPRRSRYTPPTLYYTVSYQYCDHVYSRQAAQILQSVYIYTIIHSYAVSMSNCILHSMTTNCSLWVPTQVCRRRQLHTSVSLSSACQRTEFMHTLNVYINTHIAMYTYKYSLHTEVAHTSRHRNCIYLHSGLYTNTALILIVGGIHTRACRYVDLDNVVIWSLHLQYTKCHM